MRFSRVATSSGFRSLTTKELKGVSGGTGDVIVVPGNRPEDDPAPQVLYPDWYVDNGGGGSGGGDYGVGGGGGGDVDADYIVVVGNNMTDDQGDAVEDWMVAQIDTLKEILEDNKHATALLPDGRVIPASDVLEGLSRVLSAVQAGQLVYEISKGDAKVNDAIYFAFGIAVGAAAGAAGSPAAVAAAIGTVAQTSAENLVNWINWFKFEAAPAAGDFVKSYSHYLAEQMPNNGSNTPGQFWDGMFGGPDNPYYNEIGHTDIP